MREKVQDIRTVVREGVVLTVDCSSVAGISLDGDSISVSVRYEWYWNTIFTLMKVDRGHRKFSV